MVLRKFFVRTEGWRSRKNGESCDFVYCLANINPTSREGDAHQANYPDFSTDNAKLKECYTYTYNRIKLLSYNRSPRPTATPRSHSRRPPCPDRYS